MLDQGVVVTANSSAHGILAFWGSVVEAVLYHKVHRSTRVEVLGQVLEVFQHIRVLDGETNGQIARRKRN